MVTDRLIPYEIKVNLQSETILICGNFDGFPVRLGSMGKPSPGLDLAILDQEGNKMVNKEGDIAVLITPMSDHLIFKGYRQGTDGNAIFVRPERVDKQGRRWYTTGDRGYVDNDGYFWFVGREDDVCLARISLTTGDKLLWLPDRSFRSRIGVEGNTTTNRANCQEHPCVAESAVVGSPHPIRHTIVKAFIVLSPMYHHIYDDVIKAKELIKELQDFVKTHTGPYKYPRAIEFVKDLPKTVSGKIRRVELRAKEWEGFGKGGKKTAKL